MGSSRASSAHVACPGVVCQRSLMLHWRLTSCWRRPLAAISAPVPGHSVFAPFAGVGRQPSGSIPNWFPTRICLLYVVIHMLFELIQAYHILLLFQCFCKHAMVMRTPAAGWPLWGGSALHTLPTRPVRVGAGYVPPSTSL